jgi:transcriptional regulator with XRE-family HTH domain
MNALREIRLKAGIKQSELSDLTGIAQSAISDYERFKKNMMEDTIRRFAEALNVSPGEILGDKPRRK